MTSTSSRGLFSTFVLIKNIDEYFPIDSQLVTYLRSSRTLKNKYGDASPRENTPLRLNFALAAK